MLTIDELLEAFGESVSEELETANLADWSINVAGYNLVDTFAKLSTEDLRDLQQEIEEGSTLQVTINISDAIYRAIQDILQTRVVMLDESDDEPQEMILLEPNDDEDDE